MLQPSEPALFYKWLFLSLHTYRTLTLILLLSVPAGLLSVYLSYEPLGSRGSVLLASESPGYSILPITKQFSICICCVPLSGQSGLGNLDSREEDYLNAFHNSILGGLKRNAGYSFSTQSVVAHEP